MNELKLSIDLSEKSSVRNLFIQYEKIYKNDGINSVRGSLELIGDGEIIDKGDERFMYKELLKNDSLILVVHSSLTKSIYGGKKGYSYEIALYKNNPTTKQIGGGYGASGIISINHTQLFGYCDYDNVYHNINIISKVCEHIKSYIIEK